MFRGEATAGDETIDASRALKGRPACDVEETAPVLQRAFPVAFSDVIRDRLCRLIKVLEHVGAASGKRAVGHRADPTDEFERDPVDLEFLVIEHSALSVIGRASCATSVEYEYEYEYEYEMSSIRGRSYRSAPRKA